MRSDLQFYIDGQWTDPVSSARRRKVIDPATGQATAEIAMGDAADVDRAVDAAVRAFPEWSQTSPAERAETLKRVVGAYAARMPQLAELITREMGAPIGLARTAQVGLPMMTMQEMLRVLEGYPFEERRDDVLYLREAIGVCGLITPWNWPLHQIALKVVAALAAGCTMVLKPSEQAPLSALLFAEVLEEAGIPAGVFNLVHGDGATVGHALASHPDVAMVSFTGSTRAGVQVAKDAADTVKRVSQELGGKSANIILADADLAVAVGGGVRACFGNSGQSCNAPTRMLVPEDRLDEALKIAAATADAMIVGDPQDEATELGPLANGAQFERVQFYIQRTIQEGGRLVAGGHGRPDDLERGYYCRPTIFAVTPDMTIAREEVFGPVLAVIGYKTEDEAIAIANDSPYGLAAYIQSKDPAAASRVARRLRAGSVLVNGTLPHPSMPFGGYKQSGNGREWSVHGLEEYLELKAVAG